MNDNIAEVNQRPFPLIFALHPKRRLLMLFRGQRQLIGHGVDLPAALTADDNHVIGDAGKFTDLENLHIKRARLIQGLDDHIDQRLVVHVAGGYSLFCRIYCSVAAGSHCSTPALA